MPEYRNLKNLCGSYAAIHAKHRLGHNLVRRPEVNRLIVSSCLSAINNCRDEKEVGRIVAWWSLTKAVQQTIAEVREDLLKEPLYRFIFNPSGEASCDS